MAEEKRTALYETHLALGARMVPFAGWEMPVQYPAGPLEEHKAVRTAAGLFDIDHMGQVSVSGPDAVRFLQRIQVADVRTMQVGDAHYSLLCYDDGGIVDDIFIYRLPEDWLVVVNASNRLKDVAWLNAHVFDDDVTVRDISDETYMLALQGPAAERILQEVTDINLSELRFHTGAYGSVAGVRTLIGATGYSGEYGYELFFPASQAEKVWNALLDVGKPHGLLPCGLAARDSLRFEACLSLYGHEITADVDPISAGLSWVIAFDKGDFIGRDALLKVRLEKPEVRLVAFEMIERGVPRQGYAILSNGVEVGEVTTGMYSPTTGRYVGLAFVPRELAKVGTELEVLVRNKTKKAVVVKKPFYMPAYRRKSQS